VSFVYRIPKDNLGKIYRSYSVQYESRLMQLASQGISDIAQRFDPQLFWEFRPAVGEAMRERLALVLMREAHFELLSFQLLQVRFLPVFEETIIGIQLAVQSRTTNEYRQQVIRVEKFIDILAAQTNSTMTSINAAAEARARVILTAGRVRAFNITTNAKAIAYGAFAARLQLDAPHLLRYVQLRAIRTHPSSNLTVAVPRAFKSRTTTTTAAPADVAPSPNCNTANCLPTSTKTRERKDPL